ncbi:FMN-dependent NADH-azoreductase [Undibacterium terreum]|uniref:FMN dependent NADH:quinone oxidoreductase n=1 Tax=Undibacterium terreum TaxID=1224302 RepID=A0A916UVQ5_9BURK|nr:NAD(P)H-dependent oxidoreductase [Undibacterium terreum]GGC89044.1 FMN-dependent NADH-azoreductase 2 [Undibacterium terreum]
MKILHISCSPRGKASESYQLSQRILDQLKERNPGAEIEALDLAANPVSHIGSGYMAAIGLAPEVASESSKTGGIEESERLILQLERADCIVIATPMHNYTVPSVLKAWLDQVVRAGRTFGLSPEGKQGLLADRPVFVAISSGSYRFGQRGRQPDFLQPYLQAIFAMIGLHNLSFFSMQGTAFGPQALASAREESDLELANHFSA